MIELDFSEKNECTFIIARCNNQKLTLYYRDPKTEERVAYSADMIKKISGKVIDNSIQNRLNYGKKIITGFPEDHISLNGEAISSDQSKLNYNPDWMNLLEKIYADVIIKLAYLVFEGTLVGNEMPTFSLEESDSLPLENSSS